jgi:predicted nucleotidyltransferase component of viral defense system
LTDEAVIAAAAKSAFKALQARARAEHGGNTQPLLIVYAVESFLRRLSASEYVDLLVLKGGMLMAANRIRRMTKDADLSTRGLANDEDDLREVVASSCALTPDPHDGVIFDATTIRTENVHEDAQYQGVRCKLVAVLAQARIPFALDFSFSDPGRSTVIELASVIDQPAIRLHAYPLTRNRAEKIVTAMQRRETSTRDRDFADLWVTSRRHRLDARELKEHVFAVADHREQPIITMADALTDVPDRQQPYAAMVARMSYLSPPPENWSDLIEGVIEFIDPLLADGESHLTGCAGADRPIRPRSPSAGPSV